MESTDVILNTAFAERRFMLDVFMTPKPLPCNIPTISQSELALHTGHRADSRIWIGVHGKVYDVTDFCSMHPGGTNIIKSNGGVDCSRSFDLLAHTNNPEVSSLLNKYFIGQITPKPEFHSDELGMMYDLWLGYLQTCVETVVASHFEMDMIMGSSNVWFQGNLFNMGGVRRFYHYQSRLLQGGFSAMFGSKLQELYLKLSFILANTGPSRLPDVLGIITRAKTSTDAITTSNEVAQIGQFTCNSEAARFHEKGILSYARKSVELDMEFLEDIREEACRGMDAFDTVMELEAQHRTIAISTFLMQVMERMANKLEGFYNKLAQYSVYHPEMERNPARTRWNLLKRKIRDGSFFLLTQAVVMSADTSYTPSRGQGAVEFDQVINQIQRTISTAPRPNSKKMGLTEQHVARAQTTETGSSAYETHENVHAVQRMTKFINTNMRAIRRLSKMPTSNISFEHLMSTYGPPASGAGSPGPGLSAIPASRSSSRSEFHGPEQSQVGVSHARSRSGIEQHPRQLHQRSRTNTSDDFTVATSAGGPRPVSAAAAMAAIMGKMNQRPAGAGLPSPPESIDGRNRSSHSSFHSSLPANAGMQGIHTTRPRSTTNSLRSFKLGSTEGLAIRRSNTVTQPTF
jgi:cytochrome b involved in lipid metabolism